MKSDHPPILSYASVPRQTKWMEPVHWWLVAGAALFMGGMVFGMITYPDQSSAPPTSPLNEAIFETIMTVSLIILCLAGGWYFITHLTIRGQPVLKRWRAAFEPVGPSATAKNQSPSGGG